MEVGFGQPLLFCRESDRQTAAAGFRDLQDECLPLLFMRGWAVVFILLGVALPTRAADYQLFQENGKTGLRDQSGKVILPATFDALGWSDGGFSVINQVTGYRQNSKWGLIHLTKRLITGADFESVTSSGADRVIASKWINSFTKKFGCLDLAGKVTVPFLYDGISIHGLRAIVFVKNGTRYNYGLIDLNDKSILPLRFRDIKPIGTLRLAIQNFEEKTALYSEQGIQLSEFTIDSISAFKKGKAIIYQDFKQGVISREGVFEKEPVYREVRIAEDGSVDCRAFNEWTIIDEQNREGVRINADRLSPSSEFTIAALAGKHGLVGTDLKTILPLQYDYLGPIKNQLLVARKKNKSGLITVTGQEVLPLKFDSLSYENNFITAAERSMGTLNWSVYDTFGVRKTERFYESLAPYNGKFFLARNYGYFGAVDRYGKELLACVYDSIAGHTFSLVSVKFKGQYGIVNFSEDWVVLPQPHKLELVNEQLYLSHEDSITFLKKISGEVIYFTQHRLLPKGDHLEEWHPNGTRTKISFDGLAIDGTESDEPSEITFEESEGLRGILRDGRYGFIDTRGRLRVANRYEGIGKFKEGVAPVKILGKWGFVNADDKIVINPNYEAIEGFNQGIALAKRNGKWGLINNLGTVLLEFRYDSIRTQGNHLIIDVGHKLGLADKTGAVLIEPRFDQLTLLPNHQVLIGNDNQWGVLTQDGLSIIPMIYDDLVYSEAHRHYLAHKKSKWKK